MSDVCRVDEQRAAQALLAALFLLQEMAAAMALDGKLARSGLPDSFLGAAVGLNLGHGRGSITRFGRNAKGKTFTSRQAAILR